MWLQRGPVVRHPPANKQDMVSKPTVVNTKSERFPLDKTLETHRKHQFNTVDSDYKIDVKRVIQIILNSHFLSFLVYQNDTYTIEYRKIWSLIACML